ncbi:hypothetical protein E1B28_007891 [Marasmius oreades]|uniref:Uncharacterized protein n=1 Tax=Marasmius oreades TaxID=181124 RepID=A0A9P7S4E4_9AGAR|nr:uncharacterized protein E1B28_007891 [Marasmius oreades]KAG7094288.1 hypothetical protein E1B28_007891 [Marasmius oreades]
MVSKLSVNYGNDGWFSIPASFDDPEAMWDRSKNNYELIAFKDEENNRVGYYMDLEGFTTYVTVRQVFDQIDIKQVPPSN